MAPKLIDALFEEDGEASSVLLTCFCAGRKAM
jgi:hypothetical protein